jgi:hypothetical protein
MRNKLVVAGATLAAAGIAVGVGELTHAKASPTTTVRTDAQAAITNSSDPVDFGGGMTFTPQSATSARAATTNATSLTAASAYSKASSHRTIPADVRYQAGFLTQKLRPTAADPNGSYVWNNKPVWAFVRQTGCDRGFGVTPLPVSASGSCETWAFLDSTTGVELLEFQSE